MRVTRGSKECALEMADRVERESETIRKVCTRGGEGLTRCFPGIKKWPEVRRSK